MVDTASARIDVDNIILTKTLTYYKMNDGVKDLFTGEVVRNSWTTYSIKAQATIQNSTSDYVLEGKMRVGDMIGVFRYEYTEETDEEEIIPTLTPKQGDMIKYLDKLYMIDSCTPVTSEDESTICWEFTAKETDNA